jgi:hypothetical protein
MGPERLNPTDLAKLTDERIEIVKAALQLTPDQMKYWPAVEDAIRTRAQNRQARIARIVETVGKRSDDSVIDILRNRNPVEFLNRRADALAQRSADLKKLADAWQPLYQTLTPEQKRRMAKPGGAVGPVAIAAQQPCPGSIVTAAVSQMNTAFDRSIIRFAAWCQFPPRLP